MNTRISSYEARFEYFEPLMYFTRHESAQGSNAEFKKYIVGYNSTTRHLESLAMRSLARTKDPNLTGEDISPDNVCKSTSVKPLAAIFVPRSDQPAILHSHLPLLAQTASAPFSESPTTSVVTLPKGAEKRLSSALSIPSVGLVGIFESAPDADLLIAFIRSQVPMVEVPWVREAVKGKYFPVEIKAVHPSASIET